MTLSLRRQFTFMLIVARKDKSTKQKDLQILVFITCLNLRLLLLLLLLLFMFLTLALANGFSLESEWQQVSRTLLSILANLNNAVVWRVLFPSTPIPAPILWWLYKEHQLQHYKCHFHVPQFFSFLWSKVQVLIYSCSIENADKMTGGLRLKVTTMFLWEKINHYKKKKKKKKKRLTNYI